MSLIVSVVAVLVAALTMLFVLRNHQHLYFETPFSNHAVVIDFNTPNAGPVARGAGSAFFLHAPNGSPTAGCVSIPQPDLMAITRWLQPADHPRILIGTGGA